MPARTACFLGTRQLAALDVAAAKSFSLPGSPRSCIRFASNSCSKTPEQVDAPRSPRPKPATAHARRRHRLLRATRSQHTRRRCGPRRLMRGAIARRCCICWPACATRRGQRRCRIIADFSRGCRYKTAAWQSPPAEAGRARHQEPANAGGSAPIRQHTLSNANGNTRRSCIAMTTLTLAL